MIKIQNLWQHAQFDKKGIKITHIEQNDDGICTFERKFNKILEG